MIETARQVRLASLARVLIGACMVGLAPACSVHGQSHPPTAEATPKCLPDGSGYFRARLSGMLDTELDWDNQATQCTGAVRPTDQGIRMQFIGRTSGGERVTIVIGIAKLREGVSAKAVPVNVTLIREGSGEFYGTLGDDKCMLDRVSQQALVGIPRRVRLYRVVARGFCTEPARSVRGQGSILISRFDYAGRVDFGSETAEESTDQP
jgi:hypothetical protein